MHILYLHQYFCPPGGSGNNRSLEFARSWVNAGCKVTVVTSPAYFPEGMRNSSGWREIEFEVEGINVVVVNVDYSHMMGFRKRVFAWLKFYRKALRSLKNLQNDWDLVYASSTPLTVGELGRRIARLNSIPLVFETVDVWPDVPVGMGIIRNERLIAWLQKRTNKIYEAAQLIVSLSEGMREQVLSHGVDAEKAIVVHNGTNPDAFPFQERPGRGETLVVYTGTVGLANGLDQLVRAAKMVEDRGRKDIRFLVLGSGNDLSRVRGLAYELDVKQLEFKGQVPKEEVGEVLGRADIGAVCFAPHPVLEANSANKFYDYLASGLPVVMNYEGWQASYIREWECGYASRQGDLNAFVDHLIALADDPKKRQEMGKQGRALVEKHFDRKVLALDLLERMRKLKS